MNTYGWDQMAHWWDEKQGDEGDLWHRALIDPPLLRLAGEVRGLHVLDLGCGNGYLSRRFARQGAIVTAVDANAPLIELIRTREAQESLGITYHVADAAHLEMLEDGIFDLVICNMALMDIENAKGAILEVSRVLKPGGRFVASINHPCFDKVNTFGMGHRVYLPYYHNLAENEPLSRDCSGRSTLATSTWQCRQHTCLPPSTVLVFSHLASLGSACCGIGGTRTN